MGEEVVSSYLRRKFLSMLQEAEADSGSESLFILHFRSIARQIESENTPIPADDLYDLIEALSDCRVFTYQSRTPPKGFKFHALNKLHRTLSELMFKRRMRKRLHAIQNKLHAPSTRGSEPAVDPVFQETHPIQDPSIIIGLDEEAERIEAWLMARKDDGGVREVGVLGRWGCGKTAFAQKVFASPTVVEEFSPRIWVCLSNLFLVGPKIGVRVVNCILDKIDPLRKSKSDSEDSLGKLLEELHETLMGKRYLIVLDNAWRVDHDWYAELYSAGLPKGSGGAVIVTSRRENAIRGMVGDKLVIRLKPHLGDDICWQIFSSAVVQQQGKFKFTYSKLSEIEPDVKRTFDGLPILFKAFGDMLPDFLIKQVAGPFLFSAIEMMFQKLHSEEIDKFQKLHSKEIEIFAYVGRAESPFEMLRDNLSTILDVLDDAEEKQLTHTSVKLWLQSLTDWAYELEDVLDEIPILVSFKGSNEALQSRASVSIYEMISRIEEMANRLQFIVKKENALGLMEHSVGQSYPSYVGLLVNEPEAYGRGEDKESITKMLLTGEDCNDSCSVIQIVGMGGIGKTTLARMVYDDRNVKKNFDVRAWVSVSEEFDVISISKTLYESVTGEPGHSKVLDSLQLRLKEELEKSKFLIVLDDVWDVQSGKWDDLCRPFQFARPGSRIIVTTRKESVASSRSTAYHMKPLPDDDCLSLLALHAGITIHNPEFKEVGLGLVNKCKGLPLAAKALGGLLRSQSTKERWLAVLESKIWYSPEGFILPVLRLSYHHLPTYLKRLFAYCSIFPKGYKFKKNELVYLWMGEGFLENPNESEEVLGRAYFNELLSRSLFQRSSDIDDYFVMHDLVHQLAQFVAGTTCYHLDDSIDVNHKISEKVRHVSFLRHDNEVFTKLKAFNQLRGLRTLLPVPDPNSLFSPPFQLSNKILTELLQKLHSLRVLSLSGYSITELPSSLCNLIHLRYLDLSGTSIMTLPDTLGDVCSLRTLSLHNCRSLCKLPPTIGNLYNLRHLDNSDTDQLMEMPVEIDKLSNLQTLPKIVLSKGGGFGLRELRRLSHLRGSLSILELQNVAKVQDAKDAELLSRELDELQLIWGSDIDQNRDREYEEDILDREYEEDILDLLRPSENLKTLKIACYGGLNFPSWIGLPSFRELSSICILSCFTCKFLPPLGQLPELKHLLIESMPNIRCISTEFYGSGVDVPFPKLETLRFDDIPKWEKWAAFADGESISFPQLHQLTISKCSKLTHVSPMKLPMLGELVLEECSKFLVESFCNLDSLNSLKVGAIEGLSCLPKELTVSLSALEVLECCSCSELLSLWPNETPLEHLTSLRRLGIADCNSLVSLGKGEQQFPRNLKHLEILGCNALESLPGNLSDIERSEIKDCSSLRT